MLFGNHGQRHEVSRRLVAILVAASIIVVVSISAIPVTGIKFALAANSPGKPNLFNPTTQSKSTNHLPPQTPANHTAVTPIPSGPSPMGCSASAFPMQPATIGLSASAPSHFDSNDGRFTVDLPAGAVSPAQIGADGGKTSLLVRQILPASGSNAGASGHYSFGTYLIQVVDATGHLASHGLLQPATLTLHYGTVDTALNVANAFAVINGSVPPCINIDPSPTPAPNTPALRATLGPLSSQQALLDSNNRTLTSSARLSSPTTSASWGTNASVATFGKPDPFEVDLSGAALTATINIDVPAGPKGFKPPLSLVYNSAGVNDQHNPQGAAPWVGEGWNMTLGSISWSERNENSHFATKVWQDTWELSDPYGTSAQLIPPTTTTSTYFDDSGNFNPSATTPIQWHTAPETYAKVFSYPSTLTLPGTSTHPPCYRVFLPNGIMEEFGCTSDSLQYYPAPSGINSGKPYISSWLLDLITDPDGNQIHIIYLQDIEQAAGMWYPRDAVLNRVEWDSPTCFNATTACTSNGGSGNLWKPLMEAIFTASPTVSYPTPLSCPPRAYLRCDDPVDLSGSGGVGAPLVQSDFVLNAITVYVQAAGSWQNLRQYQLGYDQSAPGTITADPVTGQQESSAGKLNLTQIKVVGDDSATTLPVRSFSYTKKIEYYEDTWMFPTPTTNCGPTWNTGNGQGCFLWGQSYDGNSYYMTSASDGIGLAQSFSWVNARNNTHGNGSTGYPYDPTICTTAQTTSYPCNVADDQTWSRISLTQTINSLVRVPGTTVTGTTSYAYANAQLTAKECSDCATGYSWGSQDDTDYLDFYNGKFMGFAQVTVGNPDGSTEAHTFNSTEGWGVWTLNTTTELTVHCYRASPCQLDPWWDLVNATHGHEKQLDRKATDGSTLLQRVTTQYGVVCAPPWIRNPSPPVSGYGDWGTNNLVSELDLENPIVVCDIQTTRIDNYTHDGSGITEASLPHRATTSSYETGTAGCSTCFGRLTNQTTVSNDGSANGSPTTIVTTTNYIWNDSVSATSPWNTGPYLINFPAFSDTEDGSGNHYQCTQLGYDGRTTGTTGQSSGLQRGDLTEQDRYTNCGTAKAPTFAPSGPITTTYGYDNGAGPFGNPWWTDDPDANGGVSTHKGCTVFGVAHSACITFDGYFGALPTQQSNALSQTSSSTFQVPANATASGGFGLWLMSTTDANNQTTAYTYDALGRQTTMTLPGETTGLTTQSMTYTVWCSGSAAQSPCAEIDRTQRLNNTTTTTYRAFYDGMGHLAETRSPAPGNQDVVQYYYYDPSQRLTFKSIPYFVNPAYTGGPGSAAYSQPDTSVAGTLYAYDGLGRQISLTDPVSKTTNTNYTVVCTPPGTGGDQGCYEQALTTDPLNHQSGVLTDAMGRINYEQRYAGNSTPYALYATTRYSYDYVGDLAQILHPDGSTATTFQYDMAGRKTAMTDPDRGTETYYYDQDGNLIQSNDARSPGAGAGPGTIYIGYDGINRPIWRKLTTTSQPYDTYSYDSGANGVGRLTSETFSGASLSGSYGYSFDVRGQQTGATLTVGTTTYPLQSTYDDAGSVLTQTYPNGETVTNSYGNQDWLSGVSTSQGSTNLLSGAAYTSSGGAAGFITSAAFANGKYQFSAAFDALARATDLNVKRTSDQTTMFDQTRTFDAVGNVSTANTTLSTGTDNQAFCYDEQNRLTWAGSAGTPTCSVTLTPGTLTAAQYTQIFAYDFMGRLHSGPLGTYTYVASAHVHAATAIGSSYTAAYDAAGNVTCRAPSASTTCNGTQTAAQLAYSNEGQLSGWQNQPSSPTVTASYLYDGQGNRVVQQSKVGDVTTTTVYIGSSEEDTTTGTTTTKTTFYFANGQRFATAVNGTFSYLPADGLGSAIVSLTSEGNLAASILYAPYGSVRYTSGTMPTDRGFTGQIADSTSGLDYYGARYYDPTAGQFTGADTVLPGAGFDVWGLSRYAYVEGNPINRTDPSGERVAIQGGGGGCYPCSTPPPPTQPPASSQGGSSKPLSFLTPVTNQISDFLGWVTSPGVQSVTQGVSGTLDNWWNFASSASPPGLLSDVGLGPKIENPLAHLDQAVGGNESSSSSYQSGQHVASVSQLGLIFTPGGAEEAAPYLGSKLDFLFGKAAGSNPKNLARSLGLEQQLNRVGILDTPAYRDYVAEHLAKVLNDSSNISATATGLTGAVWRGSLLMGPAGGLKMESLWSGAKLITVILKGG